MSPTKKMLVHEYEIMSHCIFPIRNLISEIDLEYRMPSFTSSTSPYRTYKFLYDDYLEVGRALNFCHTLTKRINERAPLKSVNSDLLTSKTFSSNQQTLIHQCLRGIQTKFSAWYDEIGKRTKLRVEDYHDSSNRYGKMVRTPTIWLKEILDATLPCTHVNLNE